MLRSIFAKTLWDARRSLAAWALAVAAVGAMYAGFWPTMDNPQMRQAMENYPKAMLEAMGYNDITSPTGYVASTVFGLLGPLLVIVFAIAWGTRIVAGDEEAGILDLMLAHPVSRTRWCLQRFAALVAALAAIGAALWLALLAVAGPGELRGITAGEFGAATAQLLLLGAWFGALAFAVGAATGRKAVTLGAAAGVAVLSYLANGVLPQVDGLAWTRRVSAWHWSVGGDPLRNGLQTGDSLLLLGTAAALVALGLWTFGRRDVAT